MIKLYTWTTPNGWKASIALEELDLDYEVHPVDITEGVQKEDWFLDINPNGRIPAIVDTAPSFGEHAPPDSGSGEHAVFESGAILIYLADKAGSLLPADPRGRSVAIQWLMFQMAGVGPMMGQANVFYRYAPEKIDYAIGRYQRESRRLLEVLDRRLRDVEYLAGEYSIADIANWSWAHTYGYTGIDIDGLDNLAAWIERIGERDAVQRGLAIPHPIDLDEQAESGAEDVEDMLS